MPLINTVIRPAGPADLPALAAAADRVFRTPPRPGLPGMAASYPLLFDPANAGNLWLAVAEGAGGEAIVAHAGFTLRPAALGDQRARVACFGVVFTLEEHRGQGLGSRVFAAAVAAARAGGADLGLVSGTRGLYARAGFAPYPLCRRYRVAAAADPRPVAVAAFDPAALDEVMRLHASEPVRFDRSRDEWRALTATGVVTHLPGRLFVVRRSGDGPVVSYLAVARPFDPTLPPRVLELAGDRQALADALPVLGRTLGVPAIDLFRPPHDRSLEPLAEERSWPAEEARALGCTYQCWTPTLTGAPVPFYGLDYV